jgi:hypothetical protein
MLKLISILYLKYRKLVQYGSLDVSFDLYQSLNRLAGIKNIFKTGNKHFKNVEKF